MDPHSAADLSGISQGIILNMRKLAGAMQPEIWMPETRRDLYAGSRMPAGRQ